MEDGGWKIEDGGWKKNCIFATNFIGMVAQLV